MSKKVDNQALLQNTEDYYQVEQILNKRLTPNGMMYLIKWKNYPNPKDYTWEPVQHLTEVQDLIREFNLNFDQKIVAEKAENIRPQILEKKTEKVVKAEKYDIIKSETIKSLNKQTLTRKKEDEEAGKQQDSSKKRSNPIHTRLKRMQVESEQEEIAQSKPRRLEIKAVKQGKPKNSNISKKGVIEFDKFWQRIHRHYVEDEHLIFNVNLNNKEDQVCGSVYINSVDLAKICEEKLIQYMEGWIRNKLIEELDTKGNQFQECAQFWKTIN